MKAPVILAWELTRACNLDCLHCRASATPDRDPAELSTFQGRRLLSDLAGLGTRMVILSGGEALMRPDALELARYGAQTGLRMTLATNGALVTPELAREIRASGVVRVSVSLDGVTSEVHDRIRGRPGAFDLAVSGIENLIRAGVEVQVNTTVAAMNVHQMEAFPALIASLKAVAWHVFFLVPTGRGADIEKEALRVAEYEKTIARLMNKQRDVPIEIKPTCAPQFIRVADKKGIPLRFSRGCLAGISYCIINPRGDVQPCAYLDMPLGNVRETPFDEIWRNNPIFSTLRTLEYEGKCGVCNYKGSCGGCRARAYYYSGGNYMAEDQWCLYKPPERKAYEQAD